MIQIYINLPKIFNETLTNIIVLLQYNGKCSTVSFSPKSHISHTVDVLRLNPI